MKELGRGDVVELAQAGLELVGNPVHDIIIGEGDAGVDFLEGDVDFVIGEVEANVDPVIGEVDFVSGADETDVVFRIVFGNSIDDIDTEGDDAGVDFVSDAEQAGEKVVPGELIVYRLASMSFRCKFRLGKDISIQYTGR